MKKSFLIYFLVIMILNSYSQLPKDIVWQKLFATNEDVRVADMLETDDAFYILSTLGFHAGNHNILVTKTTLFGELIWRKTYGGSSGDYATSIVLDDSGMIYFGGSTSSNDGDIQSGNKGGFDFWVVKMDESGSIIWEKTFGGSMVEHETHLLYLNNGNILACGQTFSSDFDIPMTYGSYDFWIWELTQDGEIVNDRVFGSSMMDNVYRIVQTREGGFFVLARAGINDGLVIGDNSQEDVWLLKLDRSLNIEWQKIYGGSHRDMGGNGLQELENGYIINGITQSSDGDVCDFDFPNSPYNPPYGQYDIWTIRVDSLGNMLWNIALGGRSWETSGDIFQNQDGTFTLFGTTESRNNGDVEGIHCFEGTPIAKKDIWMVQLNEEGELIDQRCFGNRLNTSVGGAVLKKSDSHYLIAGSALYFNEYDFEDVQSDHESNSDDLWFFEIMDCSEYQSEMPSKPQGVDTICTVNATQSIYTTTINNPKYEHAVWLLKPSNAGTINSEQNILTVVWDPEFEGLVDISVKVISKCDTSDYSNVKQTQVNSCSGINDVNHHQLMIYPNPAKDYTVLELPLNTKKSQLYITDIYGKIVNELSISPQQTQAVWDCSGIASGVYFYQTEISNVVYRGKVVVQR